MVFGWNGCGVKLVWNRIGQGTESVQGPESFELCGSVLFAGGRSELFDEFGDRLVAERVLR